MNKIKLILLLLAFVSILSCKKNDNSNYNVSEETETYDNYPDGTYCADVEYYNPNTATRNTYTLNVDVENHEVTVIHWPNGGWLDDSHFSPQELDSDGSCSFTSDKGYEYTIQIKGPECPYTDESRMSSDLEDHKNAITCPRCGGDKEMYEEYCNSCVEFEKNACPQCGDQKSNYDDLCDYCYKKNHTCKFCGEIKDVLSPVEKLCPDCVRRIEIVNARHGN